MLFCCQHNDYLSKSKNICDTWALISLVDNTRYIAVLALRARTISHPNLFISAVTQNMNDLHDSTIFALAIKSQAVKSLDK